MMIWAYELLYPHGSYIVDTSFTTAGIAGGTNYSYVHVSRRSTSSRSTGIARLPPSEIASPSTGEIGRIVVRDDVLWVPLIYPVRLDFVSARVRDFQGSASYGEDQERYFYKYALT